MSCLWFFSCAQPTPSHVAAQSDRCETAKQHLLAGDVLDVPSLLSENACNLPEFLAQDAIFVDGSTVTSAETDGSPSYPYRTIQAGLQAAEQRRLHAVLIAEGQYPETIHLVSGISLYGGFDATNGWSRLDHRETTVTGAVKKGDGEAQMGMQGKYIVSPTVLSMISIRVPSGPASGQSSYGLHCLVCPSLQLRDVIVDAGAGTAGLDGLESPGSSQSKARRGVAGEGGQHLTLIDNEVVAEPGTPGNAETDDPDDGTKGTPGGGGEGGGSSVGIFAKDSTGMSVYRCLVRSGSGGSGGRGGNSVFGDNAGGGGAGGASFGILLTRTMLTIDDSTSVQHGAGGSGGHSPSLREESRGKPGSQGDIVALDPSGTLTGLCHSDCIHLQGMRQ